MSVQSVDSPCHSDEAERAAKGADALDSPFVVFPALVLLLIMPLGIVLHPAWLPTLAELGALTMFGVMFRLMRR